MSGLYVVAALFLHFSEASPHRLLGLGRGNLSTDQSSDLSCIACEFGENPVGIADWLQTLTIAINPPKRKVQATPLVWA